VIEMRWHGDLSPPGSDDVLVTASVGPDGRAVALWTTEAGRQALWSRHRGSFPRPVPSRPVAVRVTVNDPAVLSTTTIPALNLAFCSVQPLPEDRLLIVGARRGSRPNGGIFDADGRQVAECDFGDGIQHVFTTTSGLVWVGYFDEGVYGDNPVAHHGIVCFTAAGDPVWTYPFDTGFGVVDDCYALNVAGETAWSSYYNSFPVVRIEDRAVTGWHSPVGGATALIASGGAVSGGAAWDGAASGGAVALVGGYREHDRFVIGALAGDRFEPLDPQRVVGPDGRALPSETRFVGRGAELHAFAGTRWYRLDLDDVI
jgi:hypothetical protein